MSLRRSILNFFIASAVLLSYTDNRLIALDAEQNWHDFYLVTIPKSGSHLIGKLLQMMLKADWKSPVVPNYDQFTFPSDPPEVSESVFEKAVLDAKSNKSFPSSHTNLTRLYLRFNQVHPNYIHIVLIRDLRDVLVSCVYFMWHEIERELGPTTFDQKLSFLINLGHSEPRNKILNIYRYAEETMPWLNDPNAILIRFEELVGEKGGGSRDLQEKSIVAIANALEVPLELSSLETLVKELFGKDLGLQMPTTFREGKIGSWKNHFNPENISDFSKKWSHLQVALGYDVVFY